MLRNKLHKYVTQKKRERVERQADKENMLAQHKKAMMM